jgi:comEA protein
VVRTLPRHPLYHVGGAAPGRGRSFSVAPAYGSAYDPDYSYTAPFLGNCAHRAPPPSLCQWRDSIVKDAMVAAGGPAENADLDRINLASPVSDGQHVYVPRLGEENPPVQPPSDQPAPGKKININSADLATLDTLPGIGPVIAQRILDYRQTNGLFDRIEDIMDVPGIGQGTFEKIQDLITTE